MAAFLKAIPGSLLGVGKGVYNTVILAGEKFSNTSLWKKPGGVATSHLKSVTSYWPESLRFRVVSKETATSFCNSSYSWRCD